MGKMVQMTTKDGRTVTIPVTGWNADGSDVEPDLAEWIRLLSVRLTVLSPDLPISQVTRDLGAFVHGDASAWLTLMYAYNVPGHHARAWQHLESEAARLLSLHLWLDEIERPDTTQAAK